jgi:hypothetical protein
MSSKSLPHSLTSSQVHIIQVLVRGPTCTSFKEFTVKYEITRRKKKYYPFNEKKNRISGLLREIQDNERLHMRKFYFYFYFVALLHFPSGLNSAHNVIIRK